MSPSATGVKITPITEPILHAEGPQWNPIEQNLLFVDTFNAALYKWSYKNRNVSSYKLDKHNSVGVIIPISNESNQYIVAADRTLYKLQWGDQDAKLERLTLVDEGKPNNQFNDGKADRQGRLWIGTLTRNKDLSVAPYGGSLYKITGNHLTLVEEKVAGTSISNGLDWSVDNKKFYYIDSDNRTVVSYDLDEKPGEIGNKKIVFDLEDHQHIKGIPDGMTIDEEGNLWIAMFGGQCILNVDPRSGVLIRKVELPATYITSACFGGPNLDILYVTSSRLHLDAEQRMREPLAGSVFAIENLGVHGIEQSHVRL